MEGHERNWHKKGGHGGDVIKIAGHRGSGLSEFSVKAISIEALSKVAAKQE